MYILTQNDVTGREIDMHAPIYSDVTGHKVDACEHHSSVIEHEIDVYAPNFNDITGHKWTCIHQPQVILREKKKPQPPKKNNNKTNETCIPKARVAVTETVSEILSKHRQTTPPPNKNKTKTTTTTTTTKLGH